MNVGTVLEVAENIVARCGGGGFSVILGDTCNIGRVCYNLIRQSESVAELANSLECGVVIGYDDRLV